MATEDKVKEGPITFVDQLRDVQGEYLMLSELYDKERVYGRKLAETMRLLQYEVDVTIPLNKDALYAGSLKEAFLASESVVIMIDENDNKFSRPLDRFPPDVILSIIQDCAPELKRLISEKRRATSIKVTALEKVLRELKKAQATFKQSKNEPEGTGEEETDEDKVPEIAAGPSQVEPKTVPVKPGVRSRDKDETFAFRGSYLEKKEAVENI